MHAIKILSAHNGLEVRTLLHIGAHTGQEAGYYKALGVQRVIFVEAIPAIFEKLQENLQKYPNYIGLCALCSSESGAEVQFNVSSNDGGSSSMLGLGNHAELYPDITYVETLTLKTVTADELIATHAPGLQFDLVVLDTQGAEMQVLRGATQILNSAKALWIEVSEEPLYENGCTFEDVSAYVRQYDFRLRHVQINRQGWGDALYVKRSAAAPQPLERKQGSGS